MAPMALRILTGLLGLLFIVIGIGFFTRPAPAAANFSLAAVGIQGLATLRADFPAFFIGTGGFALYGAWQQCARVLVFPLVGLTIALSGRVVSLAIDGYVPTAFTPMIVEAIGIIVLAASYRSFALRQS